MADLNLAAANGLTALQLYDDENGLRLMLDSIGVDIRERNKLVDDGFGSMMSIIELHTNDTSGFKTYLLNLNKTFASSSTAGLRVYFTPINVSRLVGVVHYFNHAVNSFHTVPDILNIDGDDAAEFSAHYRASLSESDDDVDVTIPKLTGHGNWVDFRDKITMKLSQTMGTRGIPLDYILDDTVRNALRANAALREVDALDINEDGLFRSSTTHFGRGYRADNKAVWDMLKSLLLGNSPYNHISSYNATSNGRGAWTTLRGFYEGADFEERTRESAFTKLYNTFYKGETARYSFEKYIASHKEAHKMLEDCNYNGGRGMDDATKIQHFKTGIKVDAGLENALCNSRANPIYRQFDQLVTFLSTEVANKRTRLEQLNSGKDRRVAAYEKTNPGRDGKFKRGNQSGDKSLTSKVVDGKKVFAKSYPDDEFSSLTSAQRSAVIRMNRAKRRAGGGRKPNGGGDSKKDTKSISAATFNELRDDMISMGDAIVAGVQRATGEEISVVTEASKTEESNKRDVADAGSVGALFRQKRARNGRH